MDTKNRTVKGKLQRKRKNYINESSNGKSKLYYNTSQAMHMLFMIQIYK